MKIKVTLVISLLVIFFLMGCMSGVVREDGDSFIDRLDKQVKKGYVRFYVAQDSYERIGRYGRTEVDKVGGDRFEQTGIGNHLRVNIFTKDTSKDKNIEIFQVSAKIGKAKFKVQLGTWVKYFDVDVKENKIHLIRIEVKSKSTATPGRTAFIAKLVKHHELLPFNKEGNARELIETALTSSDWCIRWHAIERIEKLKFKALYKNVVKLSKNDKKNIVRDEAKKVMRELDLTE